MITCTRRLQFCAGHRVYGHESKCAHLHGHNYVALITARVGELDEIGRVIDFGVLKEKVGGWIEEHWDHKMVLYQIDPLRALWLDPTDGRETPHPDSLWLAPFNPTAENMARYLLDYVGPHALKDTGVRVMRVELWETENCRAEAQS